MSARFDTPQGRFHWDPTESAARGDGPPRFGPFRLVRPIGAGSMGVVYEAVHETSGERAAVKTIDALDQDLRLTLRREIQTLRRLRHPGVIGILAEGVTDPVPWYAMQLVEGDTLEKRLARTAGEERSLERLRPLLEAIHEICAALAFVHGEGVVHGDLKPANVVLRRDGCPVLVDFGLSWRFSGASSREMLHDLAGVTGTPDYMAPEQISGEPLDARADLYAVGCMLFEVLAGRPPFAAPQPAELFFKHLSEEPQAPSTYNPAISRELDSLVLSLLQKQRATRLGHAIDVMAALERLGVCDSSPASAASPQYVYKPALAGRDAPLRELVGAARAAVEGEGAICLLVGESGIGKTYLAAEAARQAPSRMHVAVGSCTPGAAAAGAALLQPLRPLLQSVADRCLAGGPEATARLLGEHGAVLAAYEPALAHAPGLEASIAADGAGHLEQVLAALRHTLDALARETPLLVLVDDLQWADELTLRLLRSLPPGWARRRRLLLVATVREEEMSDAVTEIRRRDDVREIHLGALRQETIAALVREMLALERVPVDFARLVASQSAGNPFYVAEYLRAGLASGVLQRLSAGELRVGGVGGDPPPAVLEALPLPSSLLDLVSRRILGLEAQAREAASIGAVIGREFDPELVRLTSSRGEQAALDGLAELLRRQVVEPAAGGRFRFVHHQLAEIAHDLIEPRRRREIHAAVAAQLEADPQAQPGFHARLARHWRGAERPEKELPCADRAGAEALAAAAFSEAARHLARAVDLAAQESERGAAAEDALTRAGRERGIALALEALGETDAVERHARRALAHLGWRIPESPSAWIALLLRQAPRQGLHLLGLRPGSPSAGERREEMRAAARTAGLLTGRYFYTDDALGMLGTSVLAANLAERAGVIEDVPRAYLGLGLFTGLLRARRLAAHYLELSRRGAESRNDAAEKAFNLVGVSAYASTIGEWRRADELAQSAFALLESSAAVDPFSREIVLTQLGHVDHYLGRYATALRRYGEMLDSARRRDNPQTTTWALFSAGRSLLVLGRDVEALEHLEQARARLEERPELQSEIICLGLLAQALLRAGRGEEALACAEGVMTRLDKARSLGFPAAEGYSGTLAVYLAALRAPGGERPHLEARAQRCAKAFLRFARLVPTAEPLALLRAGQLDEARGRAGSASRRYRRALVAARRMELPRETALALWLSSQLPSTAEPQRAADALEAETLFRALGSSPSTHAFAFTDTERKTP